MDLKLMGYLKKRTRDGVAAESGPFSLLGSPSLIGGTTMPTDSEYHVSARDWPAGAGEGDLTVEQVHGVLDEFDRFYPLAVKELAKTAVPPPEAEQQR